MNSNQNDNNDIIIPKRTLKYQAPFIQDEANDRKKKYIPIITCIILVLTFFLIVMLIFMNQNSKNGQTNQGNTQEDSTEEKTSSNVAVETIWEPDPDSNDPEADYENWLISKAETAETQEDKIIAELDIISNLILKEEYSEAILRLDSISRDNLSADLLFRLYNVYSRVYQAKNDMEMYDRYVELRDEQLTVLYGEQ